MLTMHHTTTTTTTTTTTATTTLLTAVLAFVLAASPQAGATQWRKVPDVCRQLRGEGWKPKPDGAGDPKTGEMRYEGRALKIFVCQLVQDLPSTAGAKPSNVGVFMQHGGGESLSISASFWTAADRTATLDAAARTLARVARDLDLKLPSNFLERVRQGDDSSWDTLDNLRFDISKTTRESELMTQPDLKPNDVPLLTFEISIKPDDDEDPD
jgi:hypothetical protein